MWRLLNFADLWQTITNFGAGFVVMSRMARCQKGISLLEKNMNQMLGDA